MRRSMKYYWRMNLAVVLGGAVATAVLTGALLVGDSVKGSLRDLSLERLGEIDYLLLTQDFFRQDIVRDLAESPAFKKHFAGGAPAIILTGQSQHANSKARASQINVFAMEEDFFPFYKNNGIPELASALERQPGQIFPSIVINQSLQKELRAQTGDQILLTVARPDDVARGSLLGKKDTENIVETLRLTLTRTIPDQGFGRLGFRPQQTLPLNAYVALPVLQKALNQPGKLNAIVVSQKSPAELEDKSALLQDLLSKKLTLADLGLKLTNSTNSFILESRESILSPQIVKLATETAAELGAPSLASYTYLANKIVAQDRLLPYSTVTALNTAVAEPFKSLTLTTGEPAPALTETEILLNRWAAADLKAKSGASISLSYFAVDSRDQLYEKQTKFKLRGVVKMTGLAADRKLTPDFPGIADADNMADWDPPFEVDLNLIRPKDEDYWDKYRGTPKAFVTLKAGQKLWGSRFGNITSLRIAAAAGSDLVATTKQFQNIFLKKIEPKTLGYEFAPVKAQSLASSAGATDFSGLFIGFSVFLIVSAALLVGLLFRLGVEQRSREIGMLLALGYSVRKIRRRLLSEGVLLAAVGALLGLGGAALYAWLLLTGLRTWWVEAVGFTFLYLHLTPQSLVLGYIISLLVVLFSLWLGFRKLSQLPPPALLAGVVVSGKEKRSSRRMKSLALGSLVFAFVLAGFELAAQTGEVSPETFFGVGALVLISGLCFFSLWLRRPQRSAVLQPGLRALLRMAMRNSPRNPGRSMLSVALVACACFVIVAIGAFRHEYGDEVLPKASGAGGFSLIAQADIPLQHDLSTESGRLALGFSDKDSEALTSAEIIPFRFLPGEDASCLNLYQVEKPRLLGVTKTMTKRGGFLFQQLAETGDDDQSSPWELLETEIEPGVIPAFGDANSVLWILHSGLGKDLEMTDEISNQIKLRFVGLLKKSLFQSELLISEENFLKHFPGQNGYSYYLIDTPAKVISENAQILESTLSDYGFDTSTTAEKLAGFQAVENTYLSTFQTLGGLGLLLGTLGLGLILIRNVIERRGELATLRAFGFRNITLGLLVLAENAFLLVLGIAIGALSATIAVMPNLLTEAANVPWASLAGTLVLVFLVGMLASVAAVSQVVRIPLLPALRAE